MRPRQYFLLIWLICICGPGNTIRLYEPSAILSSPSFWNETAIRPLASNEWRKFARSRDGWRKPACLRGVFLSQTYAEPPLVRKRMKSRRSSGTMWRKFARFQDDWREFARFRDDWREFTRLRGVFPSQMHAEPPLVRKRMKSRRSSGTMRQKRRTKPPPIHDNTLLMSAPGHA